MKIYLVAALVIVVVFGIGAAIYYFGSSRGPTLARVAYLQQPRIVARPDQWVLQVTATGDPNVVGRRAVGLLMSAYYKIDGVPKGGADFKPPRARWPKDLGTPKDRWEGRYAMPVPGSVTALPTVKSEAGMTIELTSWPYGEVAEILHVGGYDQELPTIERLKGYIRDRHYVIAGDHEEEYLKGPGLLFAGNPSAYLTIIRYQVRPAAADSGSPGGRSAQQ